MKKIEIIIRDNQSNEIEHLLVKFNVPFYKNKLQNNITSINTIQYIIFSPDTTARTIMTQLGKIIQTNQKDVLMVSYPIEGAFSEYLEKIEDNEGKQTPPKLLQELRTLTEPATEIKRNLLFVVLIASTAALVGLFANNPTIIIGAMLIAPLLQPITAFSFNVSMFNPLKIIKAGASLGLLMIAIIGISTILTLIALQITPIQITDEIELRTEVSPSFIILAIVLGMAGTLAMTSNISGILVGVAIAAALVPPAVVMGIGIAMLDADIFFGASLLTTSNIIGLLLGTLSVFLLSGVTPKKLYKNRKIRIKYIIFIISVLLVSSVLAFWMSF